MSESMTDPCGRVEVC